MSIRALHYITGDTQQSGFRRIGGSDGFPADRLPWLNNGEIIRERARVEARASRQAQGGIQTLCHVWEYQTGDFGVPVVINTVNAIGTSRAHGFSEYVAGMTGNAAELADAGRFIRSADAFEMLDTEAFMSIPGKETVICPEEAWDPENAGMAEQAYDPKDIDEAWRLTLLGNYWKQASVRAFSEDTPSTVRVCLGEFRDDLLEDIEETIKHGKAFFSDVIAAGLPKQVQNIASMAAGVNCADRSALYTALEFDVAQNMYAEETLQLRRQGDRSIYRLNEAETEFISAVSRGEVPAAVGGFFNRYKAAVENPSATAENTPFMADYRVWYSLYCMERIAGEGHSFIEKAGLTAEHGNPKRIRDARACWILMQDLRRILENEHKLGAVRRNLVTELLEPVESALLKVMIRDMRSDGAEPFLARRNEMVAWHRRYLYSVPESQLDDLAELAVLDQKASRAPQFVRCYPENALHGEGDGRNAKLLKRLLGEVIHPILEDEKKKGKIENKYIELLKSEEFAKDWACSDRNPATRETAAEFFRQEIQDPGMHFLLYRISLEYLPETELLKTTLRHFRENNASPGTRPDERQLRIAAYSAEKYIAGSVRIDSECTDEMNRWYQACFREYGGRIGDISDIIARLGGDTTGAMVLIFRDGADGERMSADVAEAVFDTFGGADGRFARDIRVRTAYEEMIAAQRDAALQAQPHDMEASREALVKWTAALAEKAPFDVDTSDTIRAVLDSAKTGERISRSSVEDIFRRLMPHSASGDEKVRPAFTSMIKEQLDQALTHGDSGVVEWIGSMIAASDGTIAFDSTESLQKIFTSAREGERMSPADAGIAFDTMAGRASALDTTVRRAFSEMLAARRAEAETRNDDTGFGWLCDMADRSPWKNDTGWITEQHTENVDLLCSLSMKNGQPADSASISEVQDWLEQGTVSPRAKGKLQQYSDSWLKEGKPGPADAFLRYFDRIDEDCEALRGRVLDEAKAKMTAGLERSDTLLGVLVGECRPDVEKAGRKLDDLYEDPDIREKADSFIDSRFESGRDLASLTAELEQIQPNNGFYRRWREKLGELIYDQQTDMFNQQPNLEKLKELRTELEKRTGRLHPALSAAYKLIDGWEGRLEGLARKTEYEAASGMGGELREVSLMLEQAGVVRKNLCSCMRNVTWPAQDELKEKSMRHAMCGAMLQAELTDSPRPEGGELAGCPDWTKVLNSMFTRAELDEAVKKPYASRNLPVLQKLLSVAENARIMTEYGMSRAWAEDLIKNIHSSSLLRKYQTALARNRKMSEKYLLKFDSSGLIFSLDRQ